MATTKAASRSRPEPAPPVLEVEGLRTEIRRQYDVVRPLDDVSLTVKAGETVGLVGESGSGKTMTGLSVARLLPHGGAVTAGSVRLGGTELLGLDERAMRAVRGNDLGFVFQDPLTSLDPTMTIGNQVAEPVRNHRDVTRVEARQRAEEVLRLVGMPRAAERLDQYPHQLSGGQRQRAMIAMALACEPRLLIADEPTTALDVTVQAQILTLLDDLKSRLGMGMLLITHDMGVIAGRTDRVLVMYAGRIVESGPTARIFAAPRHPYTAALLRSIPALDQDRTRLLPIIPGFPPDLADPPPGCRFAPRCPYATTQCQAEDPVLAGEDPDHLVSCFHPRPVGAPTDAGDSVPVAIRLSAPADPRHKTPPLLALEGVSKEFPVGAGLFKQRGATVKAVSDVTLEVQAGETFGLVGESGCGKTTVGRMIVGMDAPDRGTVRVDGVDLAARSKGQRRAAHRELQLMFQDPYASLDPRMRVGTTIGEPLVIHREGSRRERSARVGELLEEVGLVAEVADRYPHEFSGGQRQRIGLARALALRPRLIVADEPVSALDVSIQSQVLNLMRNLQAELGLTYVVISHDLSVVKYLADRIGVMYLGKLVEVGPSEELYRAPAHPYTAALLDAIPRPDPAAERDRPASPISGELPSAVDPPSGCRFRTRCPRAQDVCAQSEPVMTTFGDGHQAACHLPLRTAVGMEVTAES